MAIGSILAIYTLFWWLTLFLVLPFRLKRKDGVADSYVRGQADSAPAQFSVWRTIFWTTLVSSIAFALYYANYRFGWIAPTDLDFFSSPERLAS